MRKPVCLLILAAVSLASGISVRTFAAPLDGLERSPLKSRAMTMAEVNRLPARGVSAVEVSDYIFGGYTGDWPSPPHADGNPRRALIIRWKNLPYRFVFAHEGSYCPWFEFPSGAGHCFQFFEGNDGWAELFNNFGRKEENSFIDVLEQGPKRVWVRWTYFGVNQGNGQRAYRATEDFWAFPNGHILRRQTFASLMPGDHRGYAREPIEMIGMCPKGKLWLDVLARDPATGDSHALAVLDAFSTNRYDVFWRRKEGAVFESTPRRSGSLWRSVDNSAGVAMMTPLREGAAFCVLGDASGFNHSFTRLKEHSFQDTGGIGWVSHSWDHWPIGWLNSQANDVNAKTLQQYPNHFSPAGLDLFALKNEEVESRFFYSLIGVGGKDDEKIRRVARAWLAQGENHIADLKRASQLPPTVE
jgi:hypothetical protein